MSLPGSVAPSGDTQSAEGLSSSIYRGWVRHRRHHPHPHAFRYRLSQLCLDLDELPALFSERWFWSLERFNLASFHRRDYHGDPERALRDEVSDRVAASTGEPVLGRIRLLSNLRSLGHTFNPVSFYYCERPDRSPQAILAEITNTPWRERHAYVLPMDAVQSRRRRGRWQFDKRFHVSPFMDMDMQYDWALGWPDEQLWVNMHVRDRERPHFDAAVVMKRFEISPAALARMLFVLPATGLRVLTAIHFEALRLWLKRNPVYDHPRKRRAA